MADRSKVENSRPLSGPKEHHVFISYTAREMDSVFETLLSTLSFMGLNVFNQRRDLAGVTVNLAEMQAHAQGSRVILALLSPSYFDSKWCRGEVEAAAAAGVPIVPVYAGGSYAEKDIKKLMEARNDPERGTAIKACFKENLIDVHNPTHLSDCISDLKQKVIRRFVDSSGLAAPAPMPVPASVPALQSTSLDPINAGSPAREVITLCLEGDLSGFDERRELKLRQVLAAEVSSSRVGQAVGRALDHGASILTVRARPACAA